MGYAVCGREGGGEIRAVVVDECSIVMRVFEASRTNGSDTCTALSYVSFNWHNLVVLYTPVGLDLIQVPKSIFCGVQIGRQFLFARNRA